MEFSAKQIAQLLKGTITGDENVKVSTLSKIEEGVTGAISFLANPAYTQYIYETNARIPNWPGLLNLPVPSSG